LPEPKIADRRAWKWEEIPLHAANLHYEGDKLSMSAATAVSGEILREKADLLAVHARQTGLGFKIGETIAAPAGLAPLDWMECRLSCDVPFPECLHFSGLQAGTMDCEDVRVCKNPPVWRSRQ
jgi:hypothetical protein